MDFERNPKKKIRVMSYEVNFKGETLRINSILDGKEILRRIKDQTGQATKSAGRMPWH